MFSITCSAWAADFVRMLYEASMRYSHNAMFLWQLWLRAVNRPQSATAKPTLVSGSVELSWDRRETNNEGRN